MQFCRACRAHSKYSDGQVRVYPRGGAINGDLARSVAEVAAREKWQLQQLHTEEGRLDEVFRNITLPETAQEVRK